MSAFNSVDLDEIEVMDVDGKVGRLSNSAFSWRFITAKCDASVFFVSLSCIGNTLQ